MSCNGFAISDILTLIRNNCNDLCFDSLRVLCASDIQALSLVYEHLVESTLWFESKPTLSVGYVGAYLDDGLHQPVSTGHCSWATP